MTGVHEEIEERGGGRGQGFCHIENYDWSLNYSNCILNLQDHVKVYYNNGM